MEFCLQHCPDEMLFEAEEISGLRRCRHRFGEFDACHNIAKNGTEPAACKNHGANLGSVTSQEAARRIIEGKAIERLEEIMREDANQVLLASPPPIDNPLQELLDLAAEVKALRLIMRDRVMNLGASEWRYTRAGVGEQVRAEIILLERAQVRSERILVNITKLKIEEMLARIKKQQIQRIERALIAALRATGTDLQAQDKAREVLIRELTPQNLN